MAMKIVSHILVIMLLVLLCSSIVSASFTERENEVKEVRASLKAEKAHKAEVVAARHEKAGGWADQEIACALHKPECKKKPAPTSTPTTAPSKAPRKTWFKKERAAAKGNPKLHSHSEPHTQSAHVKGKGKGKAGQSKPKFTQAEWDSMSLAKREAYANKAAKNALVNHHIARLELKQSKDLVMHYNKRVSRREQQVQKAEQAHQEKDTKETKKKLELAKQKLVHAEKMLDLAEKRHEKANVVVTKAAAAAQSTAVKHQKTQRALHPNAPVYVGCFKEKPARAVPNFQGKVGPIFTTGKFVNSVQQCAAMARKAKAEVFALQNGDQCWTSESDQQYKKYGVETDLKKCGARGGPYTNQVYTLTDI